MKKLFLLLSILVSTFTAKASDYAYLTFETTDGTKVSVQASPLSINISGTTLTAGSKTFTLANLSKMYFSTADQTTGISSVTTSELDAATEIYDLNGRRVSKKQLQKGVYVVKNKNGNYKIAVK